MKNYIFGIRPVIEAIKSGKTIDKVIIRNSLQGDLISELIKELKKEKILFQFVPQERINKITSQNSQGVVAYISPIDYFNLEDIVISCFESGKVPIILLLDNITDVRNFGAIARTAECTGIDAIVIPTGNSVSVTADAIKTSAGALSRIPVCKEDNLADTVYLLQQMGIKVIAASEKASENLYDEDFTCPVAIIIGSEDKGISNKILKISDKLVKIPILGEIASLNVSVASAVIVYEIIRQRGVFSKVE
jgi:23S rRNA (guanosine2251-2'-O)-methyltransferase